MLILRRELAIDRGSIAQGFQGIEFAFDVVFDFAGLDESDSHTGAGTHAGHQCYEHPLFHNILYSLLARVEQALWPLDKQELCQDIE